MRVFPKENIYVLNNGNSPLPQDETPDICKEYGVNHLWIPKGSKV